jgi:hypothetical protein
MSCPHTHEQNGVTECKHHHVVEAGLALLAHNAFPHCFWDEAFITAAYLINQLPSKSLESLTPFEKFLQKKHSYNHLKVFGSTWLHLRPYNATKLSCCSMQCVFLGYSSMHKGYKCLYIPTNRVYISRDVVFDERVFPFASTHDKPTTPISEYALLPMLLPPRYDQHVDMTVCPTMHHTTNLAQDVNHSMCEPCSMAPPSPVLSVPQDYANATSSTAGSPASMHE